MAAILEWSGWPTGSCSPCPNSTRWLWLSINNIRYETVGKSIFTYPATTMKQSSLFHVSARYVPLPKMPMATILMNISMAKKAKMKSSSIWISIEIQFRTKESKKIGKITWRIRHRLVLQTWSIHGWYIPSVTQLKKMTAMLTLSNHVLYAKPAS